MGKYCVVRRLPLMRETTTNRMKQSSWTLKKYIKTKYHCLPTIYSWIKAFKNFMNSRINNKLAKNKQKVFKIMDSYIEIWKKLERCSEALTKTGIELFHRDFNLFKTLDYKMVTKQWHWQKSW